MVADRPGWNDRRSELDPDRVVVRYVREDDYERIADHLLLCFGRWPAFEIDCAVSEHVAWKLHANADSWAQQIVAVLDDDDGFVVVIAIRIRRPGWVLGERRVVLDVADQATHPDWRMIHINEKRGAFREREGHETHDFQITWLPQHPATRKGNLDNPTLGNRVLVFWRPSGLRDLWAVPFGTRGWRHAAGVAARAVLGRLRRGRSRAFGGWVVDLERFDERTDALWEAARREFDFAIERTHEYLNWRYADPRAGRYEIRAAIEGDEVVGYCVTKTREARPKIVDLLVRPGRDDALGALLDDAIARGDARGRRSIYCWLPTRHPYVGALRSRGFLDTGRDPSLRYRPMAMTEEEWRFLQDPRLRVHMTQGDSDFI